MMAEMTIKDLLRGGLGFGTAPLGNMFRDIPEDEARATVNAAARARLRAAQLVNPVAPLPA